MSSHSYTTALSHLVLAGTSVTCLLLYSKEYKKWNYGHTSFTILSVNSILGLWKWGNPDYGSKIDGVYSLSSHLQQLTVLPFITTQMYRDYGYQKELIYLHAICSFLPILMYLMKATNNELNEALLIVYGVSLGTVSFLEENYWGIAAAVSYGMSFFWTLQGEDMFEMPAGDFFNYAMCFFTFFSYKALLE